MTRKLLEEIERGSKNALTKKRIITYICITVHLLYQICRKNLI